MSNASLKSTPPNGAAPAPAHPDGATSAGAHANATTNTPGGATNAGGASVADAPDGAPSTAPDDGYPEQKHAGAVGYGPQYHQGAGFADKVAGLKEELRGRVTKNPGLAEHGRERRTGELKQKELEAEDDAFAAPDEKKIKEKGEGAAPGQGEAGPQGGAAGGGAGAGAKGAKEQAATVAPEGTGAAEGQKRGEAVDGVKDI